MSSRRFEELPVWQRARELCRGVYGAARQDPFRHDRGLVDQMTRAAVSVLSNIAEGVERGTTAELLNFLYIAKGSAGEVRAQLYVAEDQGYLTRAAAERLRAEACDVAVQLATWIRSLLKTDTPTGPRRRVLPGEAEKRWADGRRWLRENAERLAAEHRQAAAAQAQDDAASDDSQPRATDAGGQPEPKAP